MLFHADRMSLEKWHLRCSAIQRHRENPARLPRRRGQRGAKRPRAEAEGGRGNDSDDEGD